MKLKSCLILCLILTATSPAIASLEFNCPAPHQAELIDKLKNLNIIRQSLDLIDLIESPERLRIELKQPWANRPSYELHTTSDLSLDFEAVGLPLKRDQEDLTQVRTVSKQEIFLALAHPGRTVTYQGCDPKPLTHEIGVRQSIVAWSENMELGWPDGGPARWNNQLWERGTPKSREVLQKAFLDAFQNPKNYDLGCYTAAKLLITHATLDYYSRVAKDQEALYQVKARLYKDDDPLVNVEPPVLWAWESDFNLNTAGTNGKLVTIQTGIDKNSVVPGDWLYFINPHSPSNKKTGYEGSNAVYAGINRFASYYDPTGARYTIFEKANDVYQWRNGVFNRPADLAKEQPLTTEQLQKLLDTPEEGGLLLPIRVVPIDMSSPILDKQLDSSIVDEVVHGFNRLKELAPLGL